MSNAAKMLFAVPFSPLSSNQLLHQLLRVSSGCDLQIRNQLRHPEVCECSEIVADPSQHPDVVTERRGVDGHPLGLQVSIPACLTGRATASIQPGKVGQARCSRAPVRLHGPVYLVPPPRTSPPVAAPCTRLPARVLGPVPPVPTPHTRPAVCFACPALSEPSSSSVA